MTQTLNLPEGRTGQILAAGLTMMMLLAIWFGLITPMLGWYAGRAETLTTMRLEVAHMRALAAGLPVLRADAAAIAARSSGAQILLDGGSDAIAGANLQTMLNDLATQAGTSLDSAETTAAQQKGALRQISVAVSFDTKWPILIAFLVAIDTARPRMLVNDLSVTVEGQADPRQDATLQTSFSVSAFRAGVSP